MTKGSTVLEPILLVRNGRVLCREEVLMKKISVKKSSPA